MFERIGTEMAKERGNWSLDKSINLATGINLVQLVAFVWFGASFYTTVSANQVLTEKRFTEFAEQRKIYNDQMMKMQDAQTNLTINMAAMSKDISSISKDVASQSTSINEISGMLRSQPIGRAK